jgi:PHP family Zn ribbon phosphoesterase
MPEIVADFHVHSRFSRACSKFLTLAQLDNWGRAKGTDLIGTADFTHPVWWSEISSQLSEVREGIFELKPEYRERTLTVAGDPSIEFILTSEIATIWSQGGKLRRMHSLLIAPSIKAVERLNDRLGQVGKLRSDGRPVLGMSARSLAQLAWSIHENFLVIPAHAWTPWFAVFGSMSGFDSLEECYGDVADRIYAIETGHSSDPLMNWRVSALDAVALISSSDAHSVQNLGREATIFSVESRDALTFSTIAHMIREASPKWRQQNFHLANSTWQVERGRWKNYLKSTIEFFPEEGKYHYDGHRACGIRLHPDQTKQLGGKCPSCGRPVTVGVYARVAELADRPEGYRPDGAPDFLSIIPLPELVAAANGTKGKLSKSVTTTVQRLWATLGSEFEILLRAPFADVARVGSPELARLVGLTRQRKLALDPGYDGVYGTLRLSNAQSQPSLFGS